MKYPILGILLKRLILRIERMVFGPPLQVWGRYARPDRRVMPDPTWERIGLRATIAYMEMDDAEISKECDQIVNWEWIEIIERTDQLWPKP